jgi:hypothetical protein
MPGAGTETFWWVGHAGSATFMVGVLGAVYRTASDGVTKMLTPTHVTLFGVWGASEDEVWAVGGSPLGDGENDVILRFDGQAWELVPSPEPLNVAYFKVWGSARDDVFIVGQTGVSLHYDGVKWQRVMTGTRSTLLTVTGQSKSDVWAVGGPPAALEHWDGAQWHDEMLPFDASGLTGVAFSSAGELYVVGLAGTRWVRSPQGSWVDESELPVLGDLHSVWVGPARDAWAVGGNYVALDPGTQRKGIVVHRGGAEPALQ